MSRIEKMVSYRLNELARLELENEYGFRGDTEMITYSVRLPVELNNNLDLVAEKLELKKADLTRELLYTATKEALIALKVDPIEWAKNLTEETKK